MSGAEPTTNSVPITYIRENFEPADRLAIVALNKRTNSVIQRIATAEALIERDFQAWLRHRNDHDRCEIYVSMNALHPNAPGRTKQDVAFIRHIYLDFDVDGTAALERLRQRDDIPKPNYLIRTSPDKWQVVWKVQAFEKEQAEQLQRGLARNMGADPAATDCTRVLRLPGFHNHKYERPYLIQAQCLTVETYGPNHFPKIVAERQNDRPTKSLTGWTRSCGGISQSERDWAFAKRALARGDSPALVASAIGASRRFDKSDPQYYADLTVRKAQDALRIEAPGFEEPERA